MNPIALALSSLAKWLSVRLRTKWLWLRVQLESLNPIALVAYVGILATCRFHLVFHYLFLQKHSKHNVFNPFRINAPVMFCVFRILASYVDISGIICNMN